MDRLRRRVWSLSTVELGVLLLLLNAFAWGLAALNVWTPGLRGRSGLIKGADFVHFYTLGAVAAEHRPELLYDGDALNAEQQRLVPGSASYRYVPVYGPQAALIFVPISRLPYLWAAGAWAAFTVLLYGVCLWLVWRDCASLRRHKLLVTLAACGYPPFWALVHHGQTSVLPLACVAAAWVCARRQWVRSTGFSLGSLVFKPQLGVAVAAVLAARLEGRLIAWAIVGTAVQWGAAVAVFGVGPLRDYLGILLRGPKLASQLEPNAAALHSLRGFWGLIFADGRLTLILYLLTGVAVLLLVCLIWRGSRSLYERFSALLLGIVLVAPHLGVYDLVVLAPAYLLTAEAASELPDAPRRGLRVLLALAYLAPDLGPLANLTRVQLSVPVLVTWLLALHWVGTRRTG